MSISQLLVAGLATSVDAPDIEDSTSFWRWDFAWEVLPTMLSSFFKVTLVVTVVGTVIAAILGLVIAIMIRLLPRPLAWLVTRSEERRVGKECRSGGARCGLQREREVKWRNDTGR